MSKEWKAVTDVKAFLSEKGTRRVRDSHEMTRKILHWRACSHCGLLNLKNDLTRKALNQKCVVEE